MLTVLDNRVSTLTRVKSVNYNGKTRYRKRITTDVKISKNEEITPIVKAQKKTNHTKTCHQTNKIYSEFRLMNKQQSLEPKNLEKSFESNGKDIDSTVTWDPGASSFTSNKVVHISKVADSNLRRQKFIQDCSHLQKHIQTKHWSLRQTSQEDRQDRLLYQIDSFRSKLELSKGYSYSRPTGKDDFMYPSQAIGKSSTKGMFGRWNI